MNTEIKECPQCLGTGVEIGWNRGTEYECDRCHGTGEAE